MSSLSKSGRKIKPTEKIRDFLSSGASSPKKRVEKHSRQPAEKLGLPRSPGRKSSEGPQSWRKIPSSEHSEKLSPEPKHEKSCKPSLLRKGKLAPISRDISQKIDVPPPPICLKSLRVVTECLTDEVLDKYIKPHKEPKPVAVETEVTSDESDLSMHDHSTASAPVIPVTAGKNRSPLFTTEETIDEISKKKESIFGAISKLEESRHVLWRDSQHTTTPPNGKPQSLAAPSSPSGAMLEEVRRSSRQFKPSSRLKEFISQEKQNIFAMNEKSYKPVASAQEKFSPQKFAEPKKLSQSKSTICFKSLRVIIQPLPQAVVDEYMRRKRKLKDEVQKIETDSKKRKLGDKSVSRDTTWVTSDKGISQKRKASESKFKKGKEKKKPLLLKADPDILGKFIKLASEISDTMKGVIEEFENIFLETSSCEERCQKYLSQLKIHDDATFTDEETDKLIKWLEDEEDIRRENKNKFLDTLQESHNVHMYLYKQMLGMLQQYQKN